MSKDKSRDGGNIPLEEMMRRLKDGDQKDVRPELVTREDGTQAIRKRKKKRRTSQPHKEEKKKRQKALLIQLAVMMVLVFALIAGLAFFLIKYNRSSYSDGIAAKVAEVTNTNVDFGRFTVTPLGVKITHVKLDGKDSDFLDKLTFNQVTVDRSLPSFFLGSMEGESVSAVAGDAVLKIPKSRQSPSPRELQKDFIFRHYECADFSASFGDSVTSLVRVLNTRLLMYEKTNLTELRLNKGSLKVKGFGDYAIKSGTLEVLGDSVNIAGLTLDAPTGKGEIELSESISLKSGTQSVLTAKLSDVDLSDVLSNNLGSILIGQISSDTGSMKVDLESDQTIEFIVPFTAPTIQLDRLQCISTLKKVLQIHAQRPSFETVRGEIRRKGLRTEISNLHLQKARDMIISGNMTVTANGGLLGTLSVGVNQERIIAPDGSFIVHGFSEPRDGMCWIDIQLSGSISSPLDDLRQTLESATRSGGVKAVGGFEGVFEQLTE